MLNTADIFRGFTDTMILAVLAKGDSWGYQINKEISLYSKGAVVLKEATLYTSFRRLEASGFILSYWGDETTGARRRYYAITEAGRNFYSENCTEWQQMKQVLDALLLNNTTKKESEGAYEQQN